MSRQSNWNVRYGYETGLFILVSVFDIVMTHRLIRTGQFRESNPLAAWFYDHWDFDGMIVFKMIMVSVVVVLTQAIARRRPAVARWLLHLATGIAAAVVIYSLLLLLLRSRGYV